MNRSTLSRLERFWVYLGDRMRHGRSWWITDDLKRSVRCFQPSIFARGDDVTGGAMSAREYREIRKSLRRRSGALALGVLGAWVMLLYAAFLVIEVSLELARFGFSRDSAKSLVWIVVFGLAGLFALRGLGSDPDAIAKELRSRRRCPSCAFDLRENIPLDGSVTRCPECEACWRFAPQSNHA